MDIEKLFIKRYIVQEDYPQVHLKDDDIEHRLIVGDILMHLKVNGAMTYRRVGRCGYMSVGVPCIKNPEKYPAIFSELSWWSHRKIYEMPDYLKRLYNGEIVKVRTYSKNGWYVYLIGKKHKQSVRRFLPATEVEFINQKR